MNLNRIIENIFQSIPLSLLEVWGSFGFIVGFILMLLAYGGFTFRTGDKWAFGREWQAWDEKAFVSMAISFVFIWVAGYAGSFFVLVPAAQTFESFKDLAVFLCIVLFGYPALVVAPFAYGLSDFYEGVPVDFMSDWWIGYFINPACFWLAHQFLCKLPDFKLRKTWRRYFIFVALFMSIEPVLWGYICSGKFSTEDAYYIITPSIFYTTLITWVLAPISLLIVFPLVRKTGYFWAEIPGHVKQKLWRQKHWVWESNDRTNTNIESKNDGESGVPIRLFILAPFVVTTLIIMGTTSYFSLKSSQENAASNAERFQQASSKKISLKLDYYFSKIPERMDQADEKVPLEQILDHEDHFVYILNKSGKLNSVFGMRQDLRIVNASVKTLLTKYAETIAQTNFNIRFNINLQSARNRSKETWMLQAVPVANRQNLILITAIPESYYLAGVREGQSQSALWFAFGLVLELLVVGILGSMVITPIRRTCHAAYRLSQGVLTPRVPGSKLAEMNTLSKAFNSMAESMQTSFNDLLMEENRLKLAVQTGNLGVWEWDIEKNKNYWNDIMYQHYDMTPGQPLSYKAWSRRILAADFLRVSKEFKAALKGIKEFDTEYRIRWGNGSLRILRSHGKTIWDDTGKPVKMVGINYDVTEARNVQKELLLYRNQLEEVVERRTRDLLLKSAELQELKQKQAKAEIHEKIAQIFLSMRDYTNSPLQAQTLSIELLKKHCPGQLDIILNMEKSVLRLATINRILSRLESTFSNITLLSENEILDYLDRIEHRA